MGNSVGFYAVADQLNAGRVGSPAQSELDMLITETGVGSRNMKRLSVNSISSQGNTQSQACATSFECVDMEARISTPSSNSVESGQSAGFRFEVERSQEARDTEEGCDITIETAASSRTPCTDEDERHSYVDTPIREANVEGPSGTEGLDYEHFRDETFDNSENARREEPDHGNDASESLVMTQPSSFIQSLLQELKENEEESNEDIGLLDEDDELFFDGRPVVYTATNPADWRLGIIEEGVTPTYWQKKSNFTLSSASDLEAYDSSEEDDSLKIGSAVNVNNIDAEREKEEGIQLCLEPFENKIGKIEECLLNSGEIYRTTDMYKQRAEDMGHTPVQSSVDVSTVIQGNHNITYLRFGAGLEDDVTSVVASEYSGSSTTHQTMRGEDKMFSHIHMVIKDVTVCTREGGAEATAVETSATLLPGPHFGRSLPAAGETPYGVGWESSTLMSEDLGNGALQVPKVTGNWQHVYRQQPSADAHLGHFAEKSGSHSMV